jgi:tRNA G10  N-methylase Trm11
VSVTANYLHKAKAKDFSLYNIGEPKDTRAAAPVKDELKALGSSARYVRIPIGKNTLDPIIISSQKVVDLVYDPKSGKLFHTVWASDFRPWQDRDRSKPYITPKSGMLPPKLARIMVNLALGTNPNQTVLDPFCGTGTVLMEALLMGASVVGSDISPDHVEGTQINIGWLKARHSNLKDSIVITSDAVHLSKQISTQVDVVVTEPFLGPPNPGRAAATNIAKGLDKLYLGALKDWSKFLKPGAKVVMVFPHFKFGKNSVPTGRFIDRRENLGYNLVRQDLFFTRFKEGITRQIVILEKN